MTRTLPHDVPEAERGKWVQAAEPVLDSQPDAMKALIGDARKVN